ncbi:transcription-repair coupling factor [Lactobacillus acetotolerans]|jgi:transcription-repair coupling factor (superfamily II helicase)|uniref:Transcription-repair-coupling factor n=2 Tax=Lactobacillus acetotolerans TaxID=1600 RepID=A0A5P5ZHE7_9LACO|nr:transcription-repair coupling factor [Lactobacillus acetotolerans]KRN40785.1 transcriptional repair coupling factor [Lactobacillus acetotolerans DSM 20749 = JCM 3825]QFG50833.1 transcription-repair coupling factor [Lactobacillus acetotolerans]QJD72566.1 transcription-repair coupling factor [Lactobacillus acetotolerans]GGV14164.1 transcription-repair-coupling factor [Lactobacillus acetotolerans DSM 20749 = JCM 3825]HBG90761.1 transcription-repair coupling factor [Lactobacillus acetotolerans]
MRLTNFLQKDQDLNNFIEKTKRVKNSLITGANAGAFSLLVKQIVDQLNVPLILIEENENKAQKVYGELNEIMADGSVQLFPVDATIATQTAVSSPDELSARIQTLNFLLSQKAGLVVTTPQALQYKLSKPQNFAASKRVFASGKEYKLDDLNNWLVQLGYRRDSLVAKPGEFAIRGDILDIYPLDRENPVRMEFFGDEIDTIKEFDLASQRSKKELKQVTVAAAQDRVFSAADIKNAAQTITKLMKDAPAPEKDVKDHFTEALDELNAGGLPKNYAFLVDFLIKNPSSLLNYLSKDGMVLLDDWPLINQSVKTVDQQNAGFVDDELKTGAMLPGQELRANFEQIWSKDTHHHIYFSLFQRSMGRIRLGQMFNWQTREPEQFFSQMPLIKTEIESYQKKGQTVILQADNKKRSRQMTQTMAEFGLDVPVVSSTDLIAGQTQIVVGSFASGFVLPSINLVYLTERELFNKRPRHKRRIKTLENAQRIRNYTELKPGDYVVHVNHGIGRFEGIKTLTSNGVKRDYITITYQHGDQLFVPADQLGLVQKYVASEGRKPHINKLGGSEWAKTKRKVQSKVEDIADDLIDLYAKRESEKGFAFSPDDDLQKKFDDAFPYVETPDQLRSIKEVKADMEQPKPMDRLLVGDVGFGKTEVALRAAFKAIEDNKQVAFLVPTTILAQQHYNTIQDRFKGFPVNFAMLSRFQTPAESKKIIKGLKDGKIDLVVGTHRLLSKDVKFKDLGLLIVDEEQRFGVKHKEKLKKMKANIDVLTLTATPIPRTLHMSMVGVRDLSVMETPPANRYPIQTYVMEQIPSVIKDACLREMQRGGQVFYLHNRVGDIGEVVGDLQRLIPNARIASVHGRMNQNQMEDILYRFLNREFDILVTTTIIETGIDMPNVNTMIIEDADHYGLSQLYQLRGRIGRSARLAYAYFLYKPNKVLTEIGEKRLDAIRDFTELGSGFKIAMRDLSIRGAGNMLGAQQHGFINSVGYDLYTQMLSDAIKERKGKKKVRKSNAEIDLGLEAYIPGSYIADQEEKIEFYKKIKAVNNQDELDKIKDELIDRFGDYPPAVENLLAISGLKIDADYAQVLNLIKTGNRVKVEFNNHASHELEGPNIFKALEHVSLKARINMTHEKRLVVLLELPEKESNRMLFNELSTFLGAASDIIQR